MTDAVDRAPHDDRRGDALKILVIGKFYVEGFAQFIAEELSRMGHSVVRYDPGPQLRSYGGRTAFYINRFVSIGHDTYSALARQVGVSGQMAALRKTIGRAGSIDLAIVCYDFLTPAESAEVKRLTKAPLVLWYPDAIANFQRHMFLNGAYDALFFKDPYIVDILRRNLAVPVYYLPECFCPHAMPAPVADEPIEERFRCDIATAGNMYAYRIAFFRNLADYEVRLWGLPPPLWMNLGPVAPMVQSRFIAGAEKARAFRGAKIVLNNLHPAEIWGANVRMFEVCGAGAFQIVDWRPGVEQLFAIGEEIVTFRSLAELKGKIDHFLAQPEERQAIAAAGRARALKDHTYEQRLKLLIETVQGRSLGYPEPTVTYASA